MHIIVSAILLLYTTEADTLQYCTERRPCSVK